MDDNGSYSALKSVKKAAAPLGVVIAGIVLSGAAKKAGVNLSAEVSLAACMAAYGFWRGLRNWIKNRRRRRRARG